jgi:MFS transporter, DHA2 family, multidrug resistance protein
MSAPAASPTPAVSWRVYVATAGVFLGAGIASLSQRLLSVGLPDLRGALGLGFDEAAWIPTACNTAIMFMGPFSVFFGAWLGRRKVLLGAGAIFTLVSILLPFSPNLRTLLVLQVIAGLSSGTFYPLSLSYALSSLPLRYSIYAIGAYSMELLSTLSLGTPLEAWLVEHLSWRWIFWTSAVLVPIMMIFIHIGFPPQPASKEPRSLAPWRGFLFLSLGLSSIYAVLEQGERLNWLDSGTVVALLAMGAFLLAAWAFFRWRSPNPYVNLGYLLSRNTLILGYGLFTLRFVLLSILVLVPGYLGAVQGYRPLETGRVLLWLAPIVVIFGFIGARIMRSVDNRLVAALAFATVAAACLLDARIDSDWAQNQFFVPQLVIAAGLAFCFVGQIGLIAQQAIDSGALTSPINVMTYGAFFQAIRIFGGQAGVALLQRFITVRSRFHTSVLGASVQSGSFLTDDHLKALTGGFAGGLPTTDELQARVSAAVAEQVGRQVATLSYQDGFIFVAGACAVLILLYALLRPMKMYFAAKLAVQR